MLGIMGLRHVTVACFLPHKNSPQLSTGSPTALQTLGQAVLLSQSQRNEQFKEIRFNRPGPYPQGSYSPHTRKAKNKSFQWDKAVKKPY